LDFIAMKRAKLTAEQIEASAWAAALASPIVADKVPPGWFTSRELCKRLGKSDTRMGELLRAALERGTCERQSFRIAYNGGTRQVPHYRLR